MDVAVYLSNLKTQLLDISNWRSIILSREWINSNIPGMPGVYAIKENNDIIYIGETGNLRGRMRDLMDSRNHNFRRKIGARHYSHIDGFIQATASNKFKPDHIENEINNHIASNLLVSYLEISLGRKELEELLIKEYFKEDLSNKLLNSKGQRKT